MGLQWGCNEVAIGVQIRVQIRVQIGVQIGVAIGCNEVAMGLQ